MQKITIRDAQRATSPNPVTLVCTRTPEGKTNLATVSWWTYLSNNPPLIGFAISGRSYTGELLVKTKRAVLSIPGEAIAEQAFKCGTASGRNVDKAAEFGIELVGGDAEETAAAHPTPLFPRHSKLAFVCNLVDVFEVGDHNFYVCEVDYVTHNPDEIQVYAWDGYKRLAPL